MNQRYIALATLTSQRIKGFNGVRSYLTPSDFIIWEHIWLIPIFYCLNAVVSYDFHTLEKTSIFHREFIKRVSAIFTHLTNIR